MQPIPWLVTKSNGQPNGFLGRNVAVAGSEISGCVIGDDQKITNQKLHNSVMDNGEVAVAK